MNNGPYKPILGKQAYYMADSGDDIAVKKPTQVVSPVPMTLLYSEGLMPGDTRHTRWVACHEFPSDTPGCILAKLDKPLYAYGDVWPLMWFAHLSVLSHHIRDGIDVPLHIGAGHVLGLSGWGRGIQHLHWAPIKARTQANGDTMRPDLIAELVASWPDWLGWNK